MKAAEGLKYLLMISLWEKRKIPGSIGLWFPFYNLACEIKAQQYRNKLNNLINKKG